MSTKSRIEAALAAKKARKPAAAPHQVARPPAAAGAAKNENPLIPLSRDLVARTPEGAEALLAMKAVRDWKGSEAIRRAHGSLANYHDLLTELHAAGRIKFRGEDFMSTTKKDGEEYGLEMHRKWVAAGKPGTFSDYLKTEEQREQDARPEQVKAGGAR